MDNTRERAARQALQHDPLARAEAARMLGGQVHGNHARRVVCPKCGHASVWWALVPVSCGAAMCNHRNSCGWAGDIWGLLSRGVA